MTTRKLTAMFTMAMLLAVLPPASVSAAPAPSEPNPDREFSVIGAGASFPFPLIDLWRVEYKEEFGNVNLNYQSIGSGGGIKQHIEKTVNFAASDKPLGKEAAEAPGTLHIPEAIGGVVVAYNLPEVPQSGLNLTGDTVADIFLDKITKWNDPRIAELNPDLDLPDEDIVPVYRSDGSGTTFIFTDYLTTVSPEFEAEIGKGKSVPWPSGLGGKGNEGVTIHVRDTSYSVGYIELAYAFQNDMNYAYIQNGDGTEFVEPTLDTLSAASAGAAPTLPPAHCDWSHVSIVNAPGPDSYPIASFTYLLVYEELEKAVSNRDLADAAVHLIHWMITDGQEHSASLLYVPIPDSVAEIGKQGLARVTFDGQQVFDYDNARDMSCPSPSSQPNGSPTNGDDNGCLIATAAFGSEMAGEVQMLRELRDHSLLATQSGTAFMTGFNQIYYSFSPTVADWERQNPAFREAVKIGMAPMLSSLSMLNHVSMDSEAEVLGYGIGVIALNLGMYVGLPLAGIVKLCRIRKN